MPVEFLYSIIGFLIAIILAIVGYWMRKKDVEPHEIQVALSSRLDSLNRDLSAGLVSVESKLNQLHLNLSENYAKKEELQREIERLNQQLAELKR
jgi:hypothetical protein